MSKPAAVIIGDIHFTRETLVEASYALIAARKMAHDLKIPLILNGDTLDGKSIIQAEVSNRLIEILSDATYPVRTIVNTGNHDLLHERSEESSLNFLRPYAGVISKPIFDDELGFVIVPYQSDIERLKQILSVIPENSIVIMHQGVQTAHLGHYMKDDFSIEPSLCSKLRVIASHYHQRQDIICSSNSENKLVGTFSYIGNPYTLGFGEAKDPAKGFSIINADGSLTFVLLDLRKHVVIESDVNLTNVPNINSQDKLWVKLTGTKDELDLVNKEEIGQKLIGHFNFRLDLIYPNIEVKYAEINHLKDADMLTQIIIDNSDGEETQRLLDLAGDV